MADEPVMIGVAGFLLAGVAFECGARCRLAASGWFPCGAHIGCMKVNQATESVQAGRG
ncbi:MAG: hypothetical protein IOC80_08800 [Rhodobacter sp.]|nr:hypothetical protein [Rhodobacter sp.]MCA3520278.1 hypothetical protein [Rhodobacter sp.]MCA3522478.1 hypothetical protein [Rhodobacter sp.]MCA3524846.1 hypothetical protein [Rhodobacter sp.]MCA3529933.1 hypothetical protein [Rhodobacter sp.]